MTRGAGRPERREHGPKASSRGVGACGLATTPPQWTVSRVLSPLRVTPGRARIIHLGDTLLRRSSALTRTLTPGSRRRLRTGRPRQRPYSSLLREGLAPPPVTRPSRVGSYPTISPLPVPAPSEESPGHRRCGFCGAFPRVTPGRRYRPPCPVEPGLSSRGPQPAGGPPSASGTREGYPMGRKAAIFRVVSSHCRFAPPGRQLSFPFRD